MKSSNEIIADNAATESKKYMKKFVVEYPEWITGRDLVVFAEGKLKFEELFYNSNEKKLLVTIIVEKV